jgi:hypothetical protein
MVQPLAWGMMGLNWAGRIILGVVGSLDRMSKLWSIGGVLAREAAVRIRGCCHGSGARVVGIGKFMCEH